MEESTHLEVFGWVLQHLARGGLMKGTSIGVLRRLAAADGIEAEDAAALRCMNRKHSKKMSNDEWINPNDPPQIIARSIDATATTFPSEKYLPS